jgi:hypothetical protein
MELLCLIFVGEGKSGRLMIQADVPLDASADRKLYFVLWLRIVWLLNCLNIDMRKIAFDIVSRSLERLR